MIESQRFSIFFADFLSLYDTAARRLGSDPAWTTATCRRCLAVLRAYRTTNEGEEILIETAIEQFDDLLRRALRR